MRQSVYRRGVMVLALALGSTLIAADRSKPLPRPIRALQTATRNFVKARSYHVELDVKGDIVLAYYFTGAAPKCRELDFSLTVDGVEAAHGTVSDFADGSYVVFEVDGLKRSANGTRFALTANDAPGPADCEVSQEEETNVHVSGVFVSPGKNMQPRSCNGLTGSPRNHGQRRF